MLPMYITNSDEADQVNLCLVQLGVRGETLIQRKTVLLFVISIIFLNNI